MALMLRNIVLKCSGFFLKPISVRTSDWLMSGMEKYSREGRKESARVRSEGTGVVLAPPAGEHTSWRAHKLAHLPVGTR